MQHQFCLHVPSRLYLDQTLGTEHEKRDQRESEGRWEGGKRGVFLLPVILPAPFGHATRVPSSVFDPNRDDWGRARDVCIMIPFLAPHLKKTPPFQGKMVNKPPFP